MVRKTLGYGVDEHEKLAYKAFNQAIDSAKKADRRGEKRDCYLASGARTHYYIGEEHYRAVVNMRARSKRALRRLKRVRRAADRLSFDAFLNNCESRR